MHYTDIVHGGPRTTTVYTRYIQRAMSCAVALRLWYLPTRLDYNVLSGGPDAGMECCDQAHEKDELAQQQLKTRSHNALECMMELLRSGYPLNARDYADATALHILCYRPTQVPLPVDYHRSRSL
eukprot:441309-Rhodomonas_salina.1